MALDRMAFGGTSGQPREIDGIEPTYNEPNTGRSNFSAFLLSGVFLAVGLLGYLYYDMAAPPPPVDTLSTGSINRPATAARPIHAPEGEVRPSRAP